MSISRRVVFVGLGAALIALAAAPGPARAGSHLWRFNEFYSSPDGAIQFIEMQEIGSSENETKIENHWYQTNTYNLDHSELLGSPLPFGTADKKFLVGSVSYAALPGVPAPDYIIPDGAIDPAGDTIVWWFYQTKVIPPNTMPSNGVLSLHVDEPAIPTSGFSLGVNSPTNFAGETGTVVLPSQVPSLGAPAAALLAALVCLSALGTRTLLRRRSA